MTKRIVVKHTLGRWSGLWRILGCSDELLKPGQTTPEYPTFVEGVNFIDHVNDCSLIAVKPRYVLYQELIAPALTSFNPRQQ